MRELVSDLSPLQVKWCGSVFPDPVSIVCQLLTESLEGMDPSLSSCLESYLHNRDSQLQTLIDVKQVRFLYSCIPEKMHVIADAQ